MDGPGTMSKVAWRASLAVWCFIHTPHNQRPFAGTILHPEATLALACELSPWPRTT